MRARQGSGESPPVRVRSRKAQRGWIVGLCAVILAGIGRVAPLEAQDAAAQGGAGVEAQAVEAPASDEDLASGQMEPLPRPVAPRSVRPYWHVFAAFGIAWLLLFGYGALLSRRLDAVERDLGRLRGGGSGS